MQSNKKSNRRKWSWILVGTIMLLCILPVIDLILAYFRAPNWSMGLLCLAGFLIFGAILTILLSPIENRAVPTQNKEKPQHKSDELLDWLDDEESETDEHPAYIVRNSKGIPEEITKSFDDRFFIEETTQKPTQGIFSVRVILILLIMLVLILSIMAVTVVVMRG